MLCLEKVLQEMQDSHKCPCGWGTEVTAFLWIMVCGISGKTNTAGRIAEKPSLLSRVHVG